MLFVCMCEGRDNGPQFWTPLPRITNIPALTPQVTSLCYFSKTPFEELGPRPAPAPHPLPTNASEGIALAPEKFAAANQSLGFLLVYK